MAGGRGLTIAIRRARAPDVGELTRLAHASKRHWGYAEELIELWERDLTITAEDLETDLVFCAEQDGRLAGFYAVSGDGEAREIEHLWVLPELIGTGVGRALFEHMTGELRKAGARTLTIASDPNAMGFYERMGARRVGSVAATPAPRTLPLFELELR